MRTLKSFDFATKSQSKYDWDTLLNGDIYELTNPKDFVGKEIGVRFAALKQARRRGMGVRTAVPSKGVVVIQGIKLDPERAAAAKAKYEEQRAKLAKALKSRKAQPAGNSQTAAHKPQAPVARPVVAGRK